jgi:hypothetical protein
MSARDEIFVGWGFGESGRNAHGFSPTKRVKISGPCMQAALE